MDMLPSDPKRSFESSGAEQVTLYQEPATSGLKALDPQLGASADFGARYSIRRVLGEGGMGVVRLCHDDRIGRDVAVKVIRGVHGSQSDLRMRFVREARVQGQLEHPSIVPVYDLGVDADGQVYFTMKLLNGSTLEEIIGELRRKDSAAEAAYGRRRLLSALSNACLAVAFAHARGVVHRDLKPGNVMLGEFGEVYVLDWGVARVTGSAEVTGSRPDWPDDTGTQAGTLLGTPGYMAPEQARGELDAIDPRSDVYSLGAILFEMLTLEPLHSGSSVGALLQSTVSGANARAAERAPERGVPPELEEICVRATATDPDQRYASARDLHNALERFLDGQRDTERRKELAQRHALDAQVALALATQQRPDAEALRSRGLRALTTALALDPAHEGALHALMRALLDPAGDLPPEAEAELKEIERKDRVRGVRAAFFAYLSWFLALLLAPLLGIKDAAWFGSLVAMVLLLMGFTAWMARTGNATPRYFVWILPLSGIAIALVSSLGGSLLLVPALAITNSAAIMVSIRANRATRNLLLMISLAAVLVPVLLELAGFVPRSYAFENGVIQILPVAVEFPPVISLVLLVVATLMTIVAANVLVGRAVETLKAAERSQFAQAWRLRQLLPDPARSAPVESAG
jgi:eukaryotic-like serine/threonine-protein kinase